ncbi:MAG: HEPN domain-containing protein [Candidatus Gastranaerophilaceae bacterium]
MKQHKELLVKNSMKKADEALTDAQSNLSLTLKQNRNYYAVFYIVLALAYLDDFQTGKHHQLMGWFNREYIYKNKIFGDKLKTIYQTLIANREKFDYSVMETPKEETVKKGFEDAKFFVQTVKEYILKRL